MQIVKHDIGIWKAEAKLEQINANKLLATISAIAEHERCPIESKHVVVFDHIEGLDQEEETKAVMEHILSKAH
jgi:hypothetical protein